MTDSNCILVIWTQSSVYEVDQKARLIRRTGGIRPPTGRVGETWKPFLTIRAMLGAPAEILWRITEEGIFQMTVTTPVLAIQGSDAPMQLPP
jgi:hypothetical protein